LLFGLAFLTPALYSDEVPSPRWQTLFPSGARQGSTCTLTVIGGEFNSWPVATWTDGADISLRALPLSAPEGAEAEPESGRTQSGPSEMQPSDIRQLEITVPADARPGVHWLRLHDDHGVTSLRPFLVGTLPEVEEQEPNDSIEQAQRLDLAAVVVNGRLQEKADADAFAVQLERGQTLVADLLANEILGSSMDAILQVSSMDGAILEQNHDTRGLDPRIVFTAPSTDTFVVRCFAFPKVGDWIIGFDGGESYVYRLTLTTQGFVDYLYPPVWNASQPGQVEPVGWNIPETARRLTTAQLPSPNGGDVFHPDLGNTAFLRMVSRAVFVEPRDSQGREPLVFQVPCWIGGVLAEPDETDVYEFDLQKDQAVNFRVEARNAGSPLDAVLVFYDSDGKQLERNDDVNEDRDSAIGYDIKEDGRYRLEIFDLHRGGGPGYFYALKAAQAEEPDFDLAVKEKLFTIQAGSTVEIAVAVKRLHGFDGAIEITATALPPGVTATKAVSEAEGDSAGTVTLKLTATGEEPRSSGSFRVVGTTTAPQALTREVRSKLPRLLPPVPHLWLTVGAPAEKAPASD
jgi:hypothetical protein